MDTATKSPLASRISALVESGIDFSSAPDEARTTLHSLRQEYPEWRKFLEHRFARLSAAQQQAVLALLEAAPAPDLAPLLPQWSRSAALPLPTRARAIEVQEHANGPVDPEYRDGLVQATRLLDQLRTAEPSPLDENDALASSWAEELAQLPLDFGIVRFQLRVCERPIRESRTGDRSPNAALDEILFVVTRRSTGVVDRAATHTPAVTDRVGLDGILLLHPPESARLTTGVRHQKMVDPVV